jgi:predicted GIY-YIG superfamily endonuclease
MERHENGVIYCLYSTTYPNRTYIGATKTLSRRIRQHNGEITGGARYTRTGRPWTIAWYVTGSPSWNTTLSCEWFVKFYSRHNLMCSSHNVMRSSHNVMRSSHNVMRSSHNVMRSNHQRRIQARTKMIQRFAIKNVTLYVNE